MAQKSDALPKRTPDTHPDLLDAAEMHANKQLRDGIAKALADKRLDLGKVQSVADLFREHVAPIEKELHEAGIKTHGEMDRAKLIPYAVHHMGAKHDGERIVSKAGQTLTNDQIRAHMKANGFHEPAYITQAPSMRGAKNFYSHYFPIRGGGSKTLTGKATDRGTFDAHPETLVEGAARTRSLLDNNEGFTKFISHVAYRMAGKDGKVSVRNWAKPSCAICCNASTSDVIRVIVTPAFSRV